MRVDLQSDRPTASRSAAPAGAPPGLPYAHLNLRRNPFGEADLSEWAALAVVDVERLVRRLEEPRGAVQLLGDAGRGKTTHLLAILPRFPGAAYVHIGENERPRIPRGEPLLIDEVQRLPRRRRRRTFRSCRSLAVGSHEDVSGELREAGFEVESVVVGAALDARRLCEILNRRVEWARRAPGPVPQVTLATAQALLDRFGDDVREILWHLYDVIQDLPGIDHV